MLLNFNLDFCFVFLYTLHANSNEIFSFVLVKKSQMGVTDGKHHEHSHPFGHDLFLNGRSTL